MKKLITILLIAVLAFFLMGAKKLPRGEVETAMAVSTNSNQVNERDKLISELSKKITQLEQEKRNLLTQKDDSVRLDDVLRQYYPNLSDSAISRYIKCIERNSKKYGLPPELVVAVIHKESNFKEKAVSSKKAVGLMQVNASAHPDKLKDMKISPDAAAKVEHNVDLGCRILREYYDQTGSIDLALEKYLGGKSSKYVKDILTTYANVALDVRKI